MSEATPESAAYPLPAPPTHFPFPQPNHPRTQRWAYIGSAAANPDTILLPKPNHPLTQRWAHIGVSRRQPCTIAPNSQGPWWYQQAVFHHFHGWAKPTCGQCGKPRRPNPKPPHCPTPCKPRRLNPHPPLHQHSTTPTAIQYAIIALVPPSGRELTPVESEPPKKRGIRSQKQEDLVFLTAP